MNERVQIVGWLPVENPKEVHHAAFAAYVHSPSMAVALLFWHPREESIDDQNPGALEGDWIWQIRLPGMGGLASGSLGGMEFIRSWGDGILQRLGLLEARPT